MAAGIEFDNRQSPRFHVSKASISSFNQSIQSINRKKAMGSLSRSAQIEVPVLEIDG